MANLAGGLGTSLLSGITGGKAASSAAKAQAQSQAAALAEQQRQYNTNQANFAPYMQAGQSALTAQQGLLGLSGTTAQASAIQNLQSSPLFMSQDAAGTNALLQNAAATGGLRGGNTEQALYQQRSSLLAQVIQSHLGNLGGLSSLGVSAVGNAGSLGQAGSNGIASTLVGQGNTAAGGILAGGAIQGRTINDFSGLLQSALAGTGGLSGTPGGATTGGNFYNLSGGSGALPDLSGGGLKF